MPEDITVVITSCGRPDLLEATIESFLRCASGAIREYILIEDSGAQGCNEHLRDRLPAPLRTIYNAENLGQMRSIDIAYRHVRTPFLFHCEDDWEFIKGGFMEESLRILNADSNVITVWLRAHDDTNGHPIEPVDRGNYRYMALDHRDCWHGFTFSPGLRRTRDCLKLHPFCELPVLVPKGKEKLPIIGEADLSVHFRRLGYRGAITADAGGYVRHLGEKRHIRLPWERGRR